MYNTSNHGTAETSDQATPPDRKDADTALEGETGAGLAEYALLLLLVAIPCVLALTTIGGALINAFQQAAGMF